MGVLYHIWRNNTKGGAMRHTENRYAGEQAKFDLACRLIAHEARTHIIARCTGFSQDRIRKLYASYFRDGSAGPIRRQRGKSPSSVAFFMRNAQVQTEASTLAGLFALFRLIHIGRDLAVRLLSEARGPDFGQRLCRAYEVYLSIHPHRRIPFEHAWSLLLALTERSDLVLADCRRCGNIYVHDVLALDRSTCPPCRRRPRAASRFEDIQ